MRLGLAGRRPRLVAALDEDRQGGPADTAAGAGDEDGTIVRDEPVGLEPGDRQRGREAGGPDGHRLAAWSGPSGQRDDPAGGDPRVLGEAAVAGDAELVAVGDHLDADRHRRVRAADDRPGQVDARG